MVLTVLFFPVFLLSMAMVMDVGRLFEAKLLAQSAADMGALAGVQELDMAQLAKGRQVLVAPSAERAAERLTKENLAKSFGQGWGHVTSEVVVRVYSATAAAPVHHLGDGRLLTEPTVCVVVHVPLSLVLFPGRSADVVVHADAAVRTKRKIR